MLKIEFDRSKKKVISLLMTHMRYRVTYHHG